MTLPPNRSLTRAAAAAAGAAALALTTLLGTVPAHAEPTGSAPAASSADGTAEEKALEQKLSADQPVAHGRTVISRGHVDIGPKFVDGRWRLMVHDDHAQPSVWRSPSEVVLRASDAAELPKPEDSAYDFVKADPGQKVYVVPQTETSGVVWPGWNTQDPETIKRLGSGATLSMDRVEGPGQFNLYLENGAFSGPQVLWTSDKAERQNIWVPKNSHTHANWVFTKPGTYFVTVTAHATLADGQKVSDTQRLQFAVGDYTDPQSVFAEGQAKGTPQAAGEESGQNAGDKNAGSDAAQSNGSDASGWWILGGGVLVLVAGAVLFLLSRRGRAAKAESARRAQSSPEGLDDPSERGERGTR